MFSRTSFINRILGNWTSLIPLVQQLTDPISKASNFVTRNPIASDVVKGSTNLIFKVICPLISTGKDFNDYKDKNDDKKNKDIYEYQKTKFFVALGLGQLIFTSLSFGCDVVKYILPDSTSPSGSGITDPLAPTSENFDNLSLTLLLIGVSIITFREIYFKGHAEDEDEARATLGAGLAAALANLPPERLAEVSKKDLRQIIKAVAGKTVARTVVTIKRPSMITASPPSATGIVVKLAEALVNLDTDVLRNARKIAPAPISQVKAVLETAEQQAGARAAAAILFPTTSERAVAKALAEALLEVPPHLLKAAWIAVLATAPPNRNAIAAILIVAEAATTPTIPPPPPLTLKNHILQQAFNLVPLAPNIPTMALKNIIQGALGGVAPLPVAAPQVPIKLASNKGTTPHYRPKLKII